MITAIKVGIKVPEFVTGEGSKRAHNAACKEALKREASTHLAKRIPNHFKAGAAQKYKMARRSKGYQRWKEQRRGMRVMMTDEHGNSVRQHMSNNADRPLVRSGNTQRKIASGATITTRGSLNNISAKLSMRVPIPGGKTRKSFDLAAGLRLLAAGKIKKLYDRDKAEQKLEIVRRTCAEIEALAPDEVEEINKSVAAFYARALKTARTVKRK